MTPLAALVVITAGCAHPRAVAKASTPTAVGVWSSDCFAANSEQGATTAYDLRETTWQIDYVLFDDRECTSKFLTIRIEGTYAIDAPSTVVPEAFDATFWFARKVITPHSDEAARFLESAEGCSRHGFVANEPADVSQAGCRGLYLPPIAACQADFDLIQVRGDELRFGTRPENNDMCTAARRPVSLEHIVNHRR